MAVLCASGMKAAQLKVSPLGCPVLGLHPLLGRRCLPRQRGVIVCSLKDWGADFLHKSATSTVRSRSAAQVVRGKGRLPPITTHQRVSDDLLVLLDPKRERLIYVVAADDGTEASLFKLRKLQRAAKPDYVYFLDEQPKQNDDLAQQVAEELGLWVFRLQGYPTPEEQHRSTVQVEAWKDQGPDWLLSRIRTPDGNGYMKWYKSQMLAQTARSAESSHSRWGSFIQGYLNYKRQMALTSSIMLIRNKDLEGLEGGDEHYNCEMQLGPEPEDYSVRFKISPESRVNSGSYAFLEKCFQEETEYLRNMEQLEEQWQGSNKTLDVDWNYAQLKSTTTGMAKASTSTSSDDEDGDSEDAEILRLVRPVRRVPSESEDDSSSTSSLDGGSSSSSEDVSGLLERVSSSYRSSSSSSASDTELQLLAEAILGRAPTGHEVLELSTALKEASVFEQAAAVQVASARSTVEPLVPSSSHKSRSGRRRQLAIPKSVLSWKSAAAAAAARRAASSASASEQQQSKAAASKIIQMVMEQLRVPQSHVYARGKDIVVVVPGRVDVDMLGEVGAAWHQREQRLMHPSVAKK